jgi:hypothetical protein
MTDDTPFWLLIGRWRWPSPDERHSIEPFRKPENAAALAQRWLDSLKHGRDTNIDPNLELEWRFNESNQSYEPTNWDDPRLQPKIAKQLNGFGDVRIEREAERFGEIPKLAKH